MIEMMTPIDKYILTDIASVRIGRADTDDIVLKNGSMADIQCGLERCKGGFQVNIPDGHRASVNGEYVSSGYILQCGDIIEFPEMNLIYCSQIIGVISNCHDGSMIQVNLPKLDLDKYVYPDVGVRDRFFHRAPRNTKEPVIENVTIENPPAKQKIEKKPLLMVIGPTFTMMIPMVLGGVLAMYSYRSSGSSSGLLMYTGLITAAASAIIGVLWAFINMHYDKKKNAQDEIDRRAGYARYLRRQIAQIKRNQEAIKSVLADMYKAPDVITGYTEQSKELWNRNRNQEDYLVERIGLGSLNVSEHISVSKIRMEQTEDELIQIPGKIRKIYSNIKGVPRCVDLGSTGIVGIVGEGDKDRAFDIARILIAQVAANNSYRDVKLAFAFDSARDGSEWLRYRFMPHVWMDDYSERLVASDKNSVDDMFFRIIDILRDREQKDYSQEKRKYTHIVLFVSDTSLLDGHAINKYITDDASRYSFTVVTLADRESQLLNDTTFELLADREFTGIHKMKTDEYLPVTFDSVSVERLGRFTDRIAVIKVNEDVEAGGIPDSLTFFDMLGIRTLDDLRVMDRWRANKTYNSMRAVIGQSAGGKDCILDVHEKYHGPHGLVAGTTGSGKSETLQTYILSMAINYSPDDIGFFIIDYKGGGMANLFDGLPHMIGAISNLSGSAIKRAMVSIKSENMRRQRVFNEAGVNNINNYTKLVKAGEAELPVPHLFIIVDEFAELKREQPEFMKELISVAQVGRSLGVHLILSTQKPAGTVDENIWSNSKFKLCLRVQDKQDSKEMLHKEDAAFITQAGRGYLQVGNDEVYELFQSGWSGAEYKNDNCAGEDSRMGILSDTGMKIIGKKKTARVSSPANSVTQLDAVKDYLADIAIHNGYTRDYSLWIPPIANPIYTDDIDSAYPISDDGSSYSLVATMGMYDDPSRQKQNPYRIDMTATGNLAICGTNVSGKSTFLQTFVASLISRYTAVDVNIYIADFSNKSLQCFAQAPQVGGFVCEDDDDRIRKLIFLINKIIFARKNILGGISFNSYKKNHRDDMPAVVFVIDNYAGFREKTSDVYSDDIQKIAHDGTAYGVYMVVTANGFGNSGIPGRLEDNISATVALQQNEKYMYSSILRTGRIEIEPENLKGRGLIKVDNEVMEFQTAIATYKADDMERIETLRDMSRAMAETARVVAECIPEIPENPTWDIFQNRRDVAEMCSGYMLPIGYDSVSAEAYGIDLRRTFCYVVAGRARTGKKNMLRILMNAAAMRGADVVIIEHGSKEFKADAEHMGAVYIDNEKTQAEYFSSLVPEFVERNRFKNQLKDQGYEELEIYDQMTRFKETYIVIADISQFLRTLYSPEEGVTRIVPFVENIMEKGALHNIFIVGSIDSADYMECRGRRVYDAMTEYHVGIQLGGNCAESSFFNFTNLSYTDANRIYKPGIGMIPQDNDDRDILQIVIPQYRRQIKRD